MGTLFGTNMQLGLGWDTGSCIMGILNGAEMRLALGWDIRAGRSRGFH